MINYFNLLEIEPAVQIDLDILSDHHKKMAAAAHPDHSEQGDDSQYRLVNTAYHTLKSDSKRIIHLMEINKLHYEKRGTVSDHLMDHFMSTAKTVQDTDAFLRKKSTATSPLTVALLESESQQLQEEISSHIDSIGNAKTATLSHASIEQTEQLANAARDLTFLEKWQAQLKERYARLF